MTATVVASVLAFAIAVMALVARDIALRVLDAWRRPDTGDLARRIGGVEAAVHVAATDLGEILGKTEARLQAVEAYIETARARDAFEKGKR